MAIITFTEVLQNVQHVTAPNNVGVAQLLFTYSGARYQCEIRQDDGDTDNLFEATFNVTIPQVVANQLQYESFRRAAQHYYLTSLGGAIGGLGNAQNLQMNDNVFTSPPRSYEVQEIIPE